MSLNTHNAHYRSLLHSPRGVHTDMSGTSGMILAQSTAERLFAYRFYGNSLQDGVPAPDAQVPIQSLGRYNAATGLWDVDVVMRSRNLSFYNLPSDGTYASNTCHVKNVMIIEGTYTAETLPTYQLYYCHTSTISLTQPLRKVGDAADYIDYARGVCVRKCAGKVFDGTEIWRPEGNHYYTQIQGKKYGPKNIICTNYTTSTNYTMDGTITGRSANSAISICDLGHMDAKDHWINFLSQKYAAGTPVTVQHQLAVPILEPITLPDIPTCGDECIIEVTDGTISASQIDLTYFKEAV